MIFQFLHSNQSCSAYANMVYDQSKSKDLLIVYNLDFNSELGYKIVFYPTEDKRWKTNHEIKTKYPCTYQNLCENISRTFGAAEFVFVE